MPLNDNVNSSPATPGGATWRSFSDGTVEWAASVVAYVTGGGAGAWTLQGVDATHGLPVAVVGTVPVSGTFWQTTQPVSAAALPLPSGAATAAKQPALGTAGSASADVLTVQGVASMTPLLLEGSGTTQPVSGTVTANAGSGTFAVSAASLPLPSGAATSAKQPALGTAGTPSADVITVQGRASMTALIVDGSAVTQPVSGTFWQVTQPVSAASLPLPSGAATAAKQPALGTAGSASADVLSVQGVASMTALKVDGSAVTQPVSGTFWQATQPVSGTVTVTATNLSANVAQVGGTAADTNSGTKSAGTLRVVLATDQPQLTNALKVDGSAVTQPVSVAATLTVADTAATTGGLSVYAFLSTAAVQAANIKNSAGQVYALHFFNNSATIAYVRLYNLTTSPATTDTPVYRALVPANTSGAGFVVPVPPGVTFGTGIGIRVTAAVADNDATALAANVILGNVFYK